MFRWLIAGTVLAVTASAADVDDGRITYDRDVLPILEKNCLGCHSPGQIAPMSFVTYETTRPWAPQIKAVVAAKKMPPAVSSPHYTMLTKDDGLTQAEIDTIVKWVDDGAAEGTAQPARKKPARSAAAEFCHHKLLYTASLLGAELQERALRTADLHKVGLIL